LAVLWGERDVRNGKKKDYTVLLRKMVSLCNKAPEKKKKKDRRLPETAWSQESNQIVILNLFLNGVESKRRETMKWKYQGVRLRKFFLLRLGLPRGRMALVKRALIRG